ncbi:MAG: hypothetical protein ACU837_17070 [Gammaproteobacteria bacterium]
MTRTLKLTLYAVFLGLLVAFNVNGDEAIPNKAYFVGTWKLDAARPTLEVDLEKRNENLKDTPYKYLAGDDVKKTSETWIFSEDGTFELKFDDNRAASDMTSKTTFTVENDTLKIAKIGRPGKFYAYKVHSREGNKMILKGGVEGYYFFTKQ